MRSGEQEQAACMPFLHEFFCHEAKPRLCNVWTTHTNRSVKFCMSFDYLFLD